MTPRELGIAFEKPFRPVQIEALERIKASKARVILVQAPTGSGKSLIARATGAILGMPATYCSTTKQLQAQFCRDFPDAVELRGRANYPTLVQPPNPEITCEDCDWTRVRGCSWCIDTQPVNESGPCRPVDVGCLYAAQKKHALHAPFAVLNTAYFLAEANHIGGFSNPDRLLVLDEADALEEQLLDTVGVKVSERQRERLRLPMPRLTQRPEEEDWREWAMIAARLAGDEASHMEAEADELAPTGGSIYVGAQRRARNWRTLADNLGVLAKEMIADPASWVRINDDKALIFRPIFVREHARRLLWDHAGRFVLMSATIIAPDQFAHDLGLEDGEWEYIELPSLFPKENRPILIHPAGSMAQRNREETIPRLIAEMDAILDEYPGRALVHTHTYTLASRVIASSRHRDRMLSYACAEEREQILNDFTASSGAGRVLVAPSMQRGVDLSDDLCRCLIVLVVPKPYYGDARVRVRMASKNGQRWYQVQQVRELCQMTGRGVRHEHDHCDTYVLDSEFGPLWRRGRDLFPDWWREAVMRLRKQEPEDAPA